MKEVDHNGYWQIKDNPISKEGVFPYYGRQISPELEPDKIYYVLRPREELKKSAETFKNVPFFNEHEMVGKGFTPADNKKEHGALGEQIYEKDGTLYANIIVRTEELKDLIQHGKKELSLGYQCTYDLTPGIWRGKKYDAVQRNLLGNHIALVKNGRMGHGVRVMDAKDSEYDAFHFACDSFDIALDFSESQVKRDEDGKFSETQGGKHSEEENHHIKTESDPIEITGNELGDYKDIKELRQKAVDYYKANLQGKTVKHPELGEVLFSGKGLRKFVSSSADENKLKMLTAVPDIINQGKYQGEEKPAHQREDGIIKFHRISKTVSMDNKKYNVSVLVGEDEAGNKFYNLNPYSEGYL